MPHGICRWVVWVVTSVTAFFLRKLFVLNYSHLGTCLLILQRVEGKERERRDIDWSLPPPVYSTGPTRDGTCNRGMCSDQESKRHPFGAQNGTPANWATWPGQIFTFFSLLFCIFFPAPQWNSLSAFYSSFSHPFFFCSLSIQLILYIFLLSSTS